MQYKYIIGYLRLSQDDEDATDESNSIKNQRLLIQQFIQGNKEFEGAKMYFYRRWLQRNEFVEVR